MTVLEYASVEQSEISRTSLFHLILSFTIAAIVSFAANLAVAAIAFGSLRPLPYLIMKCGSWCAVGIVALMIAAYARSRTVKRRARSSGLSAIAGAAYGGSMPLLWMFVALYTSRFELWDYMFAVIASVVPVTIAFWLTPMSTSAAATIETQ